MTTVHGELLTALAAQSTDSWCVVQSSPLKVTVCSITLQKQLKGMSSSSNAVSENPLQRLQNKIQELCDQVNFEFQSGDCLTLDRPIGPYLQVRVTTMQLPEGQRGFLLFFLERTAVSSVDEIACRMKALSRRQTEILAGLYGGETNRSMSIRMGISEKTVEKHRAKVMENMKAGTAAELIRMITMAQMSGAVDDLDQALPNLN